MYVRDNNKIKDQLYKLNFINYKNVCKENR